MGEPTGEQALGPSAGPRPREERETLSSDPTSMPPSARAEMGGDPLVGQLVDARYHLGPVLADGGMGTVYEALDVHADSRVALKTLQPRFSERPRVVQRFEREAQALEAARSPHVVDVIAHGRLADARPYYVMERLDGEPLSDVIERTAAPLEPRRVVRLGVQIARGLTHAHDLGIVHRDLKPENIFLCDAVGDAPHVKLLDFGLAKAVDGSTDVTKAGELLGTPSYMAPEQIRGDRVDGRTDIYAFGVMLYEMLTGRVPFEGDAAVDVMVAHVEQTPTLPSQLDPPIQLPVMLEWIAMCCLYKQPERRFQSTHELLDELLNAARLYRVQV